MSKIHLRGHKTWLDSVLLRCQVVCTMRFVHIFTVLLSLVASVGLANTNSASIQPKYSMLFDGKQVYYGGGLDFDVAPHGELLGYGLFAQYLFLPGGNGPRLLDFGAYLKLKHDFDFGSSVLSIYAKIPLGVTYGAQRYVSQRGVAYKVLDDSLWPMWGITTGVMPGVSYQFAERWAIFGEVGFNYHLLAPKKGSTAEFKSVDPDVVNIFMGAFNAGVSFSF